MMKFGLVLMMISNSWGQGTLSAERAALAPPQAVSEPPVLRDAQEPAPELSVDVSPEESAEDIVDTPVTHEEIAGDRSLTDSRPWKAVDYSGQKGALGWTETAFAVPRGMEKNYQFWIDIYTKYTTDQGVIHDSEYIDLIYEELDFTAIMMRTDINKYRKEAMKNQMVKASKKRMADLVRKIEGITDPAGLTDQERRIWEYFQKIEDPNKFKGVLSKNRMRFQLGQRDRVIQGIFFSGRYLEDFEKIFKEMGLPLELTRLPFVESSFNVLARSKVGASGLWQIMKYTGRGKLMINQAVDKRNHPIEAARLAARLLRSNYQMLNSWPLAVTGYNHGPTGVSRLVKLHKSQEIADLFPPKAKRRLGFASRNFFASFVAMLEVERNAPKYFGNVLWSAPLAAYEFPAPFAINYRDVLRWFDNDEKKAEIYNPHFTPVARKGRLPIPRNSLISVPISKREIVREELVDEKTYKKISQNSLRGT